MVAITRLHVHIEGFVQGVGFRYAAYRQAQMLGLNGWVRNTREGAVEGEFEGAREDLEAMLEWCRKGPSGAIVTKVEASWDQGEPRYTTFSITG